MEEDKPTLQRQNKAIGETLSQFGKQGYSIDKNSISRIQKVSDEDREDAEGLKELKETTVDAFLKTIVHLPKKPSFVAGDNISTQEGSTIVFEYPVLELMAGKVNTDFEVRWDKGKRK